MEKKKIVLDIDAMENFYKIFHPGLLGVYGFYTTSYVWSANGWSTSCTAVVCVKEFNGTEVESCMEFIRKNDLESRIGINNGTAMYYALSCNMTLLVTEPLTQMICSSLGISYVKESELKQDGLTNSMANVRDIINNTTTNEIKVMQLYSGTASSSYKTNIGL